MPLDGRRKGALYEKKRKISYWIYNLLCSFGGGVVRTKERAGGG